MRDGIKRCREEVTTANGQYSSLAMYVLSVKKSSKSAMPGKQCVSDRTERGNRAS